MVKALVESEEEVRKAERVEEKGASSIGPFCYWNKRKLLVSIFVDDGAQWPNRGVSPPSAQWAIREGSVQRHTTDIINNKTIIHKLMSEFIHFLDIMFRTDVVVCTHQ